MEKRAAVGDDGMVGTAPAVGETASRVQNAPTLYVVVPCYNEQEVLPETARRLGDILRAMRTAGSIGPASRVLFVDDGSSDATWELIEGLHRNAAGDGLFAGVKLAHNAGHQNALYCGLMVALRRGADAAISIDADLQDDVRLIPQMVEAWDSGAQIVYGVRRRRDKDTVAKRSTAEAFYKLMRLLGAETVPDHADYRLMGRPALEALSQYSEVNLFLRGIVPMLGFKTERLYYDRAARFAGTSKYPLKKMLAFALNGITSFSDRPIHLITLAGAHTLLVSIIILVNVLVVAQTGRAVAGWGSIMVSIWFVGGLVMVSLGVVGEYIGKIYLESKHRPRYIVEEELQ